jgi:2-polyprenyl-3-methyl-5-hydroxy-6-metoxy-1,4-benzoquinol methylase
MKTTSQKLYDQMADSYTEVSAKRTNYLESISNLVIENAPKNVIRYLDAGAGDGIRSMKIAKSVNAKSVTLIDNSLEMIELCKKWNVEKVQHSSIADFISVKKFNLITSLWNVFGHMNTRDERILSLRNIKSLLSDDGILMLDVSNRYNINYGYPNVLKNIILDYLPVRSSKLGWYEFSYKNSKYPVYLHSPFEILKIIKESGLKISKKFSVNYENGKISNNWAFDGQIFFVLKK